MLSYDLERGGLRFLVVDPADEIRNLIKAILSLTPNDILLGSELRESLALARSARPDAIIAASGLHPLGTELCRLVRCDQDLKETPVVLMTTSSNLKKYPELFESGCDEILPIPFRCNQLFSAIDRAMQRGREHALRKIHVLYKSGETGYVEPRALCCLIADKQILCFRRRDGMVEIGRDPIRSGRGSTYSGPERRTLAA